MLTFCPCPLTQKQMDDRSAALDRRPIWFLLGLSLAAISSQRGSRCAIHLWEYNNTSPKIHLQTGKSGAKIVYYALGLSRYGLYRVNMRRWISLFPMLSFLHVLFIVPSHKAEPCLLMKLYTQEPLFQPRTAFIEDALLFTKKKKKEKNTFTFPFFSLISTVCQSVRSATKAHHKAIFQNEL